MSSTEEYKAKISLRNKANYIKYREAILAKKNQYQAVCPPSWKTSKYRNKGWTPSWTNHSYIRLFYQQAAEEILAGRPAEVDHLVPIKHPLVCGLHTEDNLQVTTEAYNQYKKNLYWPNMPQYSSDDYKELYELKTRIC